MTGSDTGGNTVQKSKFHYLGSIAQLQTQIEDRRMDTRFRPWLDTRLCLASVATAAGRLFSVKNFGEVREKAPIFARFKQEIQ
jgi:hypothetical protein